MPSSRSPSSAVGRTWSCFCKPPLRCVTTTPLRERSRSSRHRRGLDGRRRRAATVHLAGGHPPAAAYDVAARPRRQDLTDETRRYRETGSLYVTRTEVYDQHDNRLGGRIGLFVMAEDEGIDIDTELDVALAAGFLGRAGDRSVHRGHPDPAALAAAARTSCAPTMRIRSWARSWWSTTRRLLCRFDAGKLRVLGQRTNIFVNPAWNLGAREAGCQLLAISNDDIAIEGELLDRAAAHLDSGGVGIIGGDLRRRRSARGAPAVRPASTDVRRVFGVSDDDGDPELRTDPARSSRSGRATTTSSTSRRATTTCSVGSVSTHPTTSPQGGSEFNVARRPPISPSTMREFHLRSRYWAQPGWDFRALRAARCRA